MKKAAFYTIMFVFFIVILEGSAVLFYVVRNGEYRRPFELYLNPNLILQTFKEKECAWAQTLVPHPYLAYLHIPSGECDASKWNFNRLGLFGPEIPLEKSEQFFDILLTGGSVAAFLGQMSRIGPRFLEVALNENYESPTGRPFRVLHGALGGWQQPHQLIMAALYGSSVSAIVTVEGFNELQRFFDSIPFRMSRSSWHVHDELVAASFRQGAPLTSAQIVYFLRAFISRIPIFRDSTFVYAIYDLTRAVLMKYDANDLTNAVEGHMERRRLYEASYAFPESMEPEQRVDWNLRQYRHYLTLIDAMAERMGVRSAFFLQPVPRIDKPLTEEELERISDRQYAEIYQRMVDNLLTLRGEGVEVISLLDTYSGMTETIYSDTVHQSFDWETGQSKGLRILAERMARELARAWQLEAKSR